MDRNKAVILAGLLRGLSLSARRAWIEILAIILKSISVMVALRKESVDRNYGGAQKMDANTVALRKESVDRNFSGSIAAILDFIVALRKESVDRNNDCITLIPHQQESLSARRAWIEIRGRRNWRSSGPRRSPQGERG